MRHRHRPELKPTDRLVLAALTTTTEPLSVAELSEATGAAPTTRLLERRGLVVRHRMGGLSNFALPTTTVATATASKPILMFEGVGRTGKSSAVTL